MARKIGEGAAVAVFVRIPREDSARLDALAETVPMLGRSGLLRAFVMHGLAAFEAAVAEKDETKRLAALARLCGLGNAR